MRLKKRAFPKITWENIAPPYKDYEYFRDCESYPFRRESSLFDIVNAWWLIEAATLVYAEEGFTRKQLQKTDLQKVEFFSGESTQCFVASNTQSIIVAFRGTETRRREGRAGFRDMVADLKTDANIRLVESGPGNRVHEGFKNALDEVWGELFEHIRSIHQSNRKVWITGHSLGAALATLAAHRYGDVQGLYTFGSPRVGDIGFKNNFHVNTYRIVNNNDIVTRLPPSGPYHHVGELEYIDSNGLIRDNPSRWKMWVDMVRGEMKNTFNSFSQVRQHGLSALISDAIKDHVPTLYAIHIWNSIPNSA